MRVECLACGAVGPERGSPGEAFLALLKVPYRTNHGDLSSTCVTSNRRMKGARGALAARAMAGMWALP